MGASRMSGRRGWAALWMATVVLGFSACAARPAAIPYQERHELHRLTVVFLDEQSLQARYSSISGKPAVSISGYPPIQSLTTVRGFYDFATKTLYCSKMDFTVCGHELHHAVLGRFHDE